MTVRLSRLASVARLAVLGFAFACSAQVGSPAEDGAGGSTSSGGWSSSGSGGSGDTSSGGMGDPLDPGTGGGTPAVIDPSFETLKFVISGYRPDINCAAADCHSGGHEHSNVPLRLVPDDQLYTQLTTHISVKCGNIPVVDPGNPEGSALVKVLKGPCEEVVPPEEPIPRMPYGCFENEWENNCVEDAYIDAIEQWIANGAPEH